MVLVIVFSLPAQTSVSTVAMAFGMIALIVLLAAAVCFGGMIVLLDSMLESAGDDESDA